MFGFKTRLMEMYNSRGLADRLRMFRRAIPDEAVLAQTFASRMAAFQRTTPTQETNARHQEFLERSASYRTLYNQGEDRLRGWEGDWTEIDGLKLWVPMDDRESSGYSNQLVQGKRLRLGEILRAREVAVGTVMLDLGANIGTTSLPRIVLGDFQYAYAAEPSPANYTALVTNVAVNSMEGRVLPDRVAIGARSGTARLRVLNKMGAHRIVTDLSTIDRGPEAEIVDVPMMTLDAWVEKLGIDLDRVTFIKCDTQGSEGEIMDGAAHVLSQKHIAWQIEFWPKGLKLRGYPIERLLDSIRANFTHFIDIRHKLPGSRVHPTSHIREVAEYYEEQQKFTELLLYSGR